jgi:hypothetical protein
LGSGDDDSGAVVAGGGAFSRLQSALAAHDHLALVGGGRPVQRVTPFLGDIVRVEEIALLAGSQVVTHPPQHDLDRAVLAACVQVVQDLEAGLVAQASDVCELSRSDDAREQSHDGVVVRNDNHLELLTIAGYRRISIL